MRELYQNHRGKIISIGFLVFIIGILWLNGERGEPTGVRITMLGQNKIGETEFKLIEASLPEEWDNPEKTPPYYHITVKVNRVRSGSCMFDTMAEFMPADRYRLDMEVIINDKVNGDIIDQKIFEGHEPPPCEDVGRIQPAIDGQLVGTAVIENWIKDLLLVESKLPAVSDGIVAREGIYTDSIDRIANLPAEWFVGIEDNPRYKLSFASRNLRLECEYGLLSNDNGLVLVERIYKIVLIEMLDLQTNEIVFRDGLIGSDPEECPETASFSVGSDRELLHGDAPEQDEVDARLDELITLLIVTE